MSDDDISTFLSAWCDAERTRDPTMSDDDITTFLSAWCDAERTGDAAFLNTHLTDDFVGVGPLGFTLPKPAWIARHQGDDLRYKTFALDEVTVRSYGPVAVVTARQDAVGTFQNNPTPQILRNTIVVIADPDRADSPGWKITQIHMSFVAGTPGAPPIPEAPAPGPATSDNDVRMPERGHDVQPAAVARQG